MFCCFMLFVSNLCVRVCFSSVVEVIVGDICWAFWGWFIRKGNQVISRSISCLVRHLL